jgi:glycosyltransferase involved in cell wall biosynthesis
MYKGMKIGIVTANYNNSARIPNYLKGLLDQTVAPDVVAIVDDYSIDDSYEVIANELKKLTNSYSIKDGLFTVNNGKTEFILAIKEKNSGPAATRNIALKILKDNECHVAIVNDSDDVFYPKKIERSVEIISKYPEVALVYSDYDVLNIKTAEKKREFKEPFSYKRLMDECIVSNNSAIAMNILDAIGNYDESLFGPEDYDLWLRISERAAVYHIPESLYEYAITGKNITITTPSNRFAEHVIKVKQKMIERQNAKSNNR